MFGKLRRLSQRYSERMGRKKSRSSRDSVEADERLALSLMVSQLVEAVDSLSRAQNRSVTNGNHSNSATPTALQENRTGAHGANASIQRESCNEQGITGCTPNQAIEEQTNSVPEGLLISFDDDDVLVSVSPASSPPGLDNPILDSPIPRPRDQSLSTFSDMSTSTDFSSLTDVSTSTEELVGAVGGMSLEGPDNRNKDVPEKRPTCALCFCDEICVVFQCGHVVCTKCSDRLRACCPFCKRVISQRITMFLP